MIESVLLICSALYAAEYLIMFLGGVRSRRLKPVANPVHPRVTVVVAARNEQEVIRQCLKSLLEQDYPHGLYTVIAVNDESEDSTLQIMQQMAGQYPDRLLKIVNTVPENSHARGKARAIAQGMDNADGDIVLLTDADCIAPPTWISGVTGYFAENIDAVGGFTVIQSTGMFPAVQQMDWLHLQSLASSAVGLGGYLGVIGNNIAFRRHWYTKVGGYRAVKFSVTEDFALFQAFRRAGARMVFPCDPRSTMTTMPCPRLGDVLRQKQRWSRGGTGTGLPGYSVLTIAGLMLLSFAVAPFVSVRAWLVVWGVKFVLDTLVMLPNMIRLGMAGRMKYFFHFEFYFIVQVFVIPILLTQRDVVWKGRIYRS